MPGYGAIASTHALATIVIPAVLTFALVWWCTEFYRAEPLWKRPVLGVDCNNCHVHGADRRDVRDGTLAVKLVAGAERRPKGQTSLTG